MPRQPFHSLQRHEEEDEDERDPLMVLTARARVRRYITNPSQFSSLVGRSRVPLSHIYFGIFAGIGTWRRGGGGAGRGRPYQHTHTNTTLQPQRGKKGPFPGPSPPPKRTDSLLAFLPPLPIQRNGFAMFQRGRRRRRGYFPISPPPLLLLLLPCNNIMAIWQMRPRKVPFLFFVCV